jgi:hypothetical protein
MIEINRGNVCVDSKGTLFLAISRLRLPSIDGQQNITPSWQGMGFNGQLIHSQSCSFVAENLNKYLQDTYGTDYSKEVAQATQSA